MRILLVFACCVLAGWAQQINHILSTGQSVSVGTLGIPPLTTTQPYANVQLTLDAESKYQRTAPLIPLIENSTPNTPGYEGQLVESPSSACANNLTAWSPGQSRVFAVSRHGLGGSVYTSLQKGTPAYAVGLAAVTGQVAVMQAIADAAGRAHLVRGVMVTHGETDFQNHLSATTYLADLLEWQADIQADVQALTGQTAPVPMYLDQYSAWSNYSHTTPTTDTGAAGVPLAQWWAQRDHPTTHLLVGPKYHLPYGSGVHLSNEGYRMLGEMHAKAMQWALDGRQWYPLAPVSITRTNAVITARFHVPVGSLVIDTTTLADKGLGKGFEYWDDSGAPPTITGVSVAGNIATITLSGTPTGGNQRLRYAYTGAGNAGTATAPHGNIRDSDSALALSGNHLWDWMITFDEPVGFEAEPMARGARLSGVARLGSGARLR